MSALSIWSILFGGLGNFQISSIIEIATRNVPAEFGAKQANVCKLFVVKLQTVSSSSMKVCRQRAGGTS